MFGYALFSDSTGREYPCVLIYIPDGSTKPRPTTGSRFKTNEAGDSKPQVQQRAEKSAKVSFLSLVKEYRGSFQINYPPSTVLGRRS